MALSAEGTAGTVAMMKRLGEAYLLLTNNSNPGSVSLSVHRVEFRRTVTHATDVGSDLGRNRYSETQREYMATMEKECEAVLGAYKTQEVARVERELQLASLWPAGLLPA